MDEDRHQILIYNQEAETQLDESNVEQDEADIEMD